MFMVTLSAEPIFHLGPLTVTNTLLDTLIVDVVLLALTWYVSKKASVIPTIFQATIEMVIDTFYDLTESVAGKKTKEIFPYVMTFFLFILIANWSGLLPIITNLGFYHGKEFTPLIRSTSTDLNTTLALALISLTATHTMSIRTLGLRHYLGRFFSLNPLSLYSGLLELVSELTKIISFSFRLFGNIFVGEVMLASISSALAFIAPIPVMAYEMFVGVIQATIFALLTMAFMAIFTTSHNPTEG